MPSKRIPTIMCALARSVPERWLHVSIEGSANIPKQGPVLIAARHYHHLYDAVALLSAVSRPVHFVVTLDWVRSALVRRVMAGLTDLAQWPVVQRTPPDSHNAARTRDAISSSGIRCAVQLLLDGSALAIFPEGYPNIDPHFTPKRTRDEFLPFRDGFARIASMASRRLRRPVPVIPTGLYFHGCPTPHMTVRFGTALYGGVIDRSAFVKRVQEEVMRLSKEGVGSRG